MTRLNNCHICFCCGRRSDGLAVGSPKKLAWFCNDCGSDTAKKALHMQSRELDSLELSVVVQVAAQAGEGDVTLTPAELPAFISWAVKTFADTMRTHLESDKAPF